MRRTTEIPADLAERVLRALADAVVVLDPEGRVTCWAGTAERVFGLTAREALGQRVFALASDLAAGGQEEVTTLGEADRLDAVQRLGAKGPPLAVTVTPLRDDAGAPAGITALVRPMGGWLDPMERAGRPRRQWHRTLGALVQELVREAGQDPKAMDASEELARMLVGQARRLLPSTECLLAVVPSESQDRFRIVAGAGPWAERQVDVEWPLADTLAGRALEEGRPLETTRALELGAVPRPLDESGIVAARLVPLLSATPLPDGRGALGLLAFCRDAPRYFTPYERRLIEEFALLVTISLHRAELVQGATDAAARLRTGVDVAVELARSLEPPQVIGRLV